MSHGCFYRLGGDNQYDPRYLPQIGLDVHATILATNSRTVFTQTFVNPSSTEPISEVSYSFPLYESSSIVGFTCHINDTVIQGTVRPKAKADEIYQEAKSKGRSAAILDRSLNAADIFSTRLGNVPASGTVIIVITLIGELSQDAQTDAIRYTIPSTITPRYGPRYGPQTASQDSPAGSLVQTTIKVDVSMEKASHIRSIQSPGHPIQVDIGRVSNMPESTFESCLASVKLQENVVLNEDFVITIKADKQDLPFALLETHPTLPDQTALMVSLVPKFSLPAEGSEFVFVVDRSGSMSGSIPALRLALELFLKSLPLGVPFNIISFGSMHEAMWPRSKMSNKESLTEALEYTRDFEADMGGTELWDAIEAAVKNRYQDKVLEVLVLTDGAVSRQSQVFDLVSQANRDNSARFFTLGVGNSVSHSLINGISRAGKGFSQAVRNNEDMNKTVVRMLKGALMPRLLDSRLDINIPDVEEDFVEIEMPAKRQKETEASSQPLSLFDETNETEKEIGDLSEPLPKIGIPRILQAPTDLPALFPFIRSNMYLLISHSPEIFPETLTLRANSKHGPLELKIPIQDVGKGQTIHQLAAKKTVTELEESRGWICSATNSQGELVTSKWESRADELRQRECERLGVKFQVAGKHCSFVAVQGENQLDPCASSSGSSLGLYKYTHAAIQAIPNLQVDRRMPSLGSRPGPKMAYSMQLERPVSMGSASRASMGPSQLFMGAQLFTSKKRKTKAGIDQQSQGEDGNLNSASALPLYRLIGLQSFEGYWEMSDNLLQTMSLDPAAASDMIEAAYQRGKGFEGDQVSSLESWSGLLATSLVCLYLENQESNSRDVWELVKNKADIWVQSELDALSSGDRQAVMKVIGELTSIFGTLRG